MPTISLTRGTLYDVDLDVDVEADRIDHIKTEEVLAYVPAGCKYRQQVIDVLMDLAKDLNDKSLVDSAGNPPASP